MKVKELGYIESVEAVRRFVELTGKTVVDIGCGDLTSAIPLVESGCQVLAMDPDPVQAEKNRQMKPIENLTFVESSAQSIPAEDCSVDGLMFSYSLHHIPAADYETVFAEVFRVLRRDGFVCVIEPDDCPFMEVMKLFHDEDQERRAAQDAIRQLAVPRFEQVDFFRFHNYRTYDSFEQFVDRFTSKSFNSLYTESDVRHPDVQQAFERYGAPDYRFAAPKIACILQKLEPAK
jgi:ubiquinone/menaquinone biosynthesis C-methylase UbiE